MINIDKINDLYDLLKMKINNEIEIVDDIEYYNDFINGIIIYFPTGECFRIFINENKNYIGIDENLSIFSETKNIDTIIDDIIKQTNRKNYNKEMIY